VATALGAYLMVAPLPCGIALALFILTVYLTRFVSLGSILSACSIPLVMWLFSRPAAQIAASLLMAALVSLKHRQNIQRLLTGQERAWSKEGS